MSSKFGQIRSGTTELAALELLKIDVAPLLVSQLCLYLGNSQVSVYRTIGPLVIVLFLCVYFSISNITLMKRVLICEIYKFKV